MMNEASAIVCITFRYFDEMRIWEIVIIGLLKHHMKSIENHPKLSDKMIRVTHIVSLFMFQISLDFSRFSLQHSSIFLI